MATDLMPIALENMLRMPSRIPEFNMTDIQGNILRNQLTRGQIGTEGLRQNILSRKFAQEQQQEPLTQMGTLSQTLRQMSPFINLNNYPMFRERAIQAGLPESFLPDVSQFKDQDEFETFKERITTSVEQQEKIQLEGVKGAIKSGEPVSDIGKLEQDRTKLLRRGYKENDLVIKAIDAEIQKKGQATQGRELNMPAEYDYAMVEKFGPEYLTPEGKTKAAEWARTKEGTNAIDKWGQKVGQWKASNVFIGGTPGGGIVTIPSKGEPIPKVTPGPKEGLTEKVMPQSLKDTATAVKQSEDLVGTLENLWNQIGVTDRMSAVVAWGEAKAGRNKNAKVYMDESKAFLGNLSRSLGGERGVLTDQDIERISRAIAKIGPNPTSVDNQEEAKMKWELIRKVIKDAHQRFIEKARMTQINPTGTANDPAGIR